MFTNAPSPGLRVMFGWSHEPNAKVPTVKPVPFHFSRLPKLGKSVISEPIVLLVVFSGLAIMVYPAGKLRFTYPTALTEYRDCAKEAVNPAAKTAAERRSVFVLMFCCLFVLCVNRIFQSGIGTSNFF